MLSRDLGDCGLPCVIDGPGDPLSADFHALRHSYVARLEQSGASLKQAMQLARHSDPKLTMARYGRARLNDLGATLDRMPSLLAKTTPEAARVKAAGTDGTSLAHRPRYAPGLGHAPDLGCKSQTTVDRGMARCRPDETGSRERQLSPADNGCERLKSVRPAGFEPATYGLGNRRSIP